ncbi:MAG: hypothetical protein WAV30_03285 [Microgenomates group bacterium]
MKKLLARMVGFAKQNPIIVSLIILAGFLHLIIIFPSGSYYCFNNVCGHYFWGVHEHDGIWHLAVAETAFKMFPPQNPAYSGVSLSGYNSFLDFILYVLGKIDISPLVSYFKILPIVWFVGFTYFSLKLSNKWSKNPSFRFIFLFLNYFGASFSFLIPLIKEGIMMGASSVLSMQAILSLTNLQLAYSYIFLLWIINLLFEKKVTNRIVFLFCVFLFIQWGLKFYTGVISSIIVGTFFMIRIVRLKKWRDFVSIGLFALSSVVSIFVNYNPLGGKTSVGSVLIFKPLELIWPLIEDRGLFYSEYWANAKYIYLASSNISMRFIIFCMFLVALFIFLNFGMRLLGFVSLLQSQFRKEDEDIHKTLGMAVLIGILFPIFFIQKGMWWNTIQFLFPIYLILNIYTADFISGLKNNLLRNIIVAFTIIVSLPYLFDGLKGYVVFPGKIVLTQNELDALGYLRQLPYGTVYAPIYKQRDDLDTAAVNPLFNHVDSAYVSAYTGKQTLYANYVQLLLLNVEYMQRKQEIEKGNCRVLANIKYIYLHSSQMNDLLFKKCIYKNKEYKKLFNNSSATVYSKI